MRGISPESVERGMMRLVPIYVAPFEFDTETVLRRFMCDATYADCMTNGPTIVKGTYNWFFINSELVELVKHQFHMSHQYNRKMNN